MAATVYAVCNQKGGCAKTVTSVRGSHMPLELDYYYGNEAEQYSFYRIPKVLFTDSRFRGVSVEAKVLYGLLLDRMSLSGL